MQRTSRRSVGMPGGVVVIVASGYALVGAVSAEPWVRYALRLETAIEPVALSDTLRMRLADELARGTGASCDFDLPEGHVTVAMDLLRRSLADGPDERAEASASPADRRQRDRLQRGDAATSGILLALLETGGRRTRRRIRELVLLSAALSPYEADTLCQTRASRGVAVVARQDAPRSTSRRISAGRSQPPRSSGGADPRVAPRVRARSARRGSRRGLLPKSVWKPCSRARAGGARPLVGRELSAFRIPPFGGSDR